MGAGRHAGPLAAALAGHAALAALLLLAAPRMLPPPAEPLSVALLPLAPPAASSREPDGAPAGADLTEAPLVEASAIVLAPAPPRPRAAAPPRPVATPPSTGDAPLAAAQPSVAADALAAWQAALSAWIDRNRRYPPAARLRQEEGVVEVRFHLAPDGRVLSVAITGSSGSGTLDTAAQTLLTGATLPAPPPGLEAGRRLVTVPIRYRLE